MASSFLFIFVMMMIVNGSEWDVINKDCSPAQYIPNGELFDIKLDGECTVNRVKVAQQANDSFYIQWNAGYIPVLPKYGHELKLWKTVYWRFDQCSIELEFKLRQNSDASEVQIESKTQEDNFTFNWIDYKPFSDVNITIIVTINSIGIRIDQNGKFKRFRCPSTFHVDPDSDIEEIYADVISIIYMKNTSNALISNTLNKGDEYENATITDPKTGKLVQAIYKGDSTTFECPLNLTTFGLFFAGIVCGIGFGVAFIPLALFIQWKRNRLNYIRLIHIANVVALRRYQIVTHQNTDPDFVRETDELEKKTKELKDKLKIPRKKKTSVDDAPCVTNMESEPTSNIPNPTSTTTSRIPTESEVDRVSKGRGLTNRKKPDKDKQDKSVKGHSEDGQNNREQQQQPSSAPHASDEL